MGWRQALSDKGSKNEVSSASALGLRVPSREVAGEGKGIRKGTGESGCGLLGALIFLPVRGGKTLARKSP